MKLIATKAFSYAGARLRVGQEFSAKSKGDARVLQALGRAALAPAATPSAAGVEKPKRTYKRRDLVAEPTNAPPAAVGGSAAGAGGEEASPPPASWASQASAIVEAPADAAPEGNA
jgi:hypothetical protein